MIFNENGRRLRILIIDDRDQLSFINNHGAHVVIEQIVSWKQAQAVLAKDGVVHGADILLIDVSMIDDHDIQNAVTKEASVPMLPAGPLIALPFIGTRAVMACKVYSAHMQNEDLHRHPYFLLAMGLIAARTETAPTGGSFLSRHLCPDVSSHLLDDVIQQHAKIFYADPESVFVPALEEYRERLDQMINRKFVTVYNRAETTEEIKRLRKSIKPGTPLRIPDSLKIAFVGDNWSDCVSLTSLFADKLKGSVSATCDWLDEVEGWLEALGDSNFDRALEVTREQDKQEELNKQHEREKAKNPRPNAYELIEKRYPKLSLGDHKEIFRFIILFANADALEFGNGTHSRVYDMLGEGFEQNIYMGWFGERQLNKGKIKPKKAGRKDLRHISIAGKDKFERCFLSKQSTVSQEDHEAIMRYRMVEGLEAWQDTQDMPYRIAGKRR